MKYLLAALLSCCLLLPAIGYTFEPFQPLPDLPPIPADNPQSAAKITLGKNLFFDRRLSINEALSCNSCHDLMRGGTLDKPYAIGATGKQGRRAVPTLWNVAYQTIYNQDGSALSLEHQLQSHLLDETTLAMPDEKMLVQRLAHISGYRQQFSVVFAQGLTYATITQALASFIRSLSTPGSDFDRFLLGEQQALSVAAQRGFDTFIEVGCAACHFWINLSGPVPGLAFKMGEGFYELFPNYPGTDDEQRYRLSDDLGRYYITRDDSDKRMWRVPVLRNIALTAPYFHNGSVATLDEAIRVMARTQLRKDLSAAQVQDITAFLHSVTGEFPELIMPRLP